MPNGEDLKNKLEQFESLWNRALSTYPSLIRWGKKPWDERGKFTQGAIDEYERMAARSVPTAATFDPSVDIPALDPTAPTPLPLPMPVSAPGSRDWHRPALTPQPTGAVKPSPIPLPIPLPTLPPTTPTREGLPTFMGKPIRQFEFQDRTPTPIAPTPLSPQEQELREDPIESFLRKIRPFGSGLAEAYRDIDAFSHIAGPEVLTMLPFVAPITKELDFAQPTEEGRELRSRYWRSSFGRRDDEARKIRGEAALRFRDRPISEQIGLGLLDPTAMFSSLGGLLRIGGKAAPALSRLARDTFPAVRTAAQVGDVAPIPKLSTPKIPTGARVAATVRGSIRRKIIDDLEVGRESTEFMFHAGSEVEGIIENGLRSGGLSTSPIAEAGYGNIIHVFRRSDLPSNISDLGADISFGRGFDHLNPPKPIASFTRKELGSKPDIELGRGARAQELGYEQTVPDELIWSPEELAKGKLLATADERELINRIERAYAPTAPAGAADVPVTPATRAAALTPDEVTELARLKGGIARDKAVLEDFLNDPDAIQRGFKPRPYTMRYPGRQPGVVGYRPPLARTAAQRSQDIVDAEDEVRGAIEEVVNAKKGVDETTGYLNQNQARLSKQGKSGKEEITSLKEDISEAKSNHTDAKSNLAEFRSDLRQAKKPTGYTAEEKAYIAAADKLDVEYPKGLRASIQRAQKDIDALEARQVVREVPTAAPPATQAARAGDVLPTAPAGAADVPVTPATRATDVPTDLAAPTTGAVAPAVQEALRKAGHFREIDAPGRFSRFLDAIPGVKQVYQYIRPGATKVPVRIQTAYVAENSEKSLFSTKMVASRQKLFDEAEQLFGPGTTRNVKTNIRFIGTDAESSSIDGFLFDVAQRPHLYDISGKQQAFLTNVWQAHNSKFMRELKEGYGSTVGEYPAPTGGVFLSNVQSNAEILDALDMTESGAAIMGRGKTRVYNTAVDRMANDPTFIPLTDIQKLQTGMDDWKSIEAGRLVFNRGVGGLTKVQAVELTHPGLLERKNRLTRKIRNLKARIATAGRQEIYLASRGRQADIRARNAERRAKPLLENVDDLGLEYGPELSYLSGQIRELLLFASKAESQGMDLRSRSIARQVSKETMETELSALAPELDKLRKAYKSINIEAKAEDLRLVKAPLFRYFPSDEAKAIEELQSLSTNKLAQYADEWRGTTFAGDLSPIVGIQLPIGFIFNPQVGIRRLVGATGATRESGDFWHVFRSRTMADEVASDPDGWREFAFWAGLDIRTAAPKDPGEFSGGLLRFLPGFTTANESMYRLVIRQTKAFYDKEVANLAQRGFTGDSAKMQAADIATMVYPMWNPKRIGLSPARAAAFRAVPTSVSFLTRPAAFYTKLSTALAKLATRQPLTAGESIAIRRALTATGSVMALSVSSAVITAQIKGKDPWDAALKVMDPTSPKFASLIFGDFYLPMGGPYRSMIKMIVPRKVPWSPVPVPFATAFSFIENRINPGLKTQVDLIANKDFHGNEIRKGEFPEYLMQILLYEIENLVPLAAGTVMGGIRRDVPPGDITVEGIGQFFGSDIGLQQPFEKREDIGRDLRKKAGLEGTYDDLVNIYGYGDGLFWAEEDMTKSPKTHWEQPPPTRQRMMEDPAFVTMTREMRERARDSEKSAYYKKIDLLRNNDDPEDLGLIQQLNQAWRQAQGTENPGYEYKEKRKDILTGYYARTRGARIDAEKAGIFRDRSDPESPFRKAEDIVNRVLYAEDKELIRKLTKGYNPIEDANGDFDWGERDRRMDHLERLFSKKFIEDMQRESQRDLPQIEKKYREDVSVIADSGYWDTDNKIERQYIRLEQEKIQNKLLYWGYVDAEPSLTFRRLISQ